MTENWYLVLELPFDPPEKDAAKIKAAIAEKKKFWDKNAQHYKYGATYRKYAGMISTIEAEMLDPTIQAEMIKDAVDKTYAPIDKMLKLVSAEGVTEDTILKMSEKLKIDADIIRKRVVSKGIKIGQGDGGEYQKIVDKYVTTKPQGIDTYKGMKKELDAMNVSNLYEFLYLNTTVTGAEKLDPSTLIERASELKKEVYFKTDSVSATGGKLCSHCAKIFADDNTKAAYDVYLEYDARMTVLTELSSAAEIAGSVSEPAYKDFLGRLTQVFKNKQEAEKLLVAYCKVNKIILPVKEGTTTNPNIKVCRCGWTNDISERKTCGNCGLALQIACPSCNQLSDNNIKICKCGFKFENLDKSRSSTSLASYAIDKMDFELAKIHLKEAERLWKNNPDIAEIQSRLQAFEARIGSAVADMKKAIEAKNFYTAQKFLDNVKKVAPEYSDPDSESAIATAISTAEKYRKTATSSTNEAAIVDACTKAYEASADCPGVKELIAKYPPAAPTALQVAADSKTRANALSWTKSATDGLIFYTVVRKEGAVPISPQDGTVLDRISMNSFSDKKIEAGKQYFYAIFAERAGIFSGALTSKEPVVNLFEISGVKLAAGDGLVQMSWDMIGDNAEVHIERTSPNGKTEKLSVPGKNNYVDRDLNNDAEYSYKIYLEYSIGTKKVATTGVKASATPTKPPQPIDRLLVKPRDNDFEITWEMPEGESGEVRFFYAENKPNYMYNDLVSIAELESSMSTLVVNKTGEGHGTFKYDGNGIIYIVAVIPKSGSGVVGTIARASKGGSVKVKDINLINGKIMITLDIPKDATGFIVLYRNDQHPSDMDDRDATRKYIPIKQANYDGGLVIDTNEPQDYYFSIFAEFRSGGDVDYSTGTDCQFSNAAKQIITYSVNVAKKLFGGGTFSVTFECERKTKLPDIDIMSAQGHAPMFKKSSTFLYAIPSQDVSGSSITFQIPMSGIGKNTYVKPFLKDESLSDRFVFKLKLGSENKIS